MGYPQLVIPFSSYSSSIFDEIADTDYDLEPVLDQLRSVLPEITGNDREECIEDTIRVAAALEVLRSDDIWLMDHRSDMIRLSTGERSTLIDLVGEDEHCFHIGGNPSISYGVRFPDYFGNRYYMSDVFLEAAGRGFSLIDIDIDGDYQSSEKQIVEQLASFTPGVKQHPGILKLTQGKHHVLKVDAIDGSDSLVSLDEQDSFLSWAFTGSLHCGTTAMVQQRLNMESEYRCFTYRGSVITGAGNIEKFTPIDCRSDHCIDGKFSTLVETERNRGDVHDSPYRVSEMLSFANQLASDLHRHEDMPDRICLDVAWDADRDRPVAVEINPIATSGLYAAPVLSTGYLKNMIKDMVSDSNNRLTVSAR